MKKSSLLFLAILTISVSTLSAEKITFSANSMSGTIGDKSDSTSLSGEASVITESMEIYADTITMSGKDFRYIEASGSVKGVNTESQLDFTCEKLKYDRETKIADLSENVKLTDTKNDVQASAQIIRYDQATDVAVMQIGIELKQKDNVCSGVYAIYRKKEQILELSGNAQIKQGNDTFRAQEISLNLDSQEITLDGRVKGSIVDERKTEDKTDDTSEKQPLNQAESETSGAETKADSKEGEKSGSGEGSSGKETSASVKESGSGETDSKDSGSNGTSSDADAASSDVDQEDSKNSKKNKKTNSKKG